MPSLNELGTGTARPKRFPKGKPIIKPSHQGLLHKSLGVPEGKNIPKSKIEAATQSKNPVLKRRAIFAQNSAGWHH